MKIHAGFLPHMSRYSIEHISARLGGAVPADARAVDFCSYGAHMLRAKLIGTSLYQMGYLGSGEPILSAFAGSVPVTCCSQSAGLRARRRLGRAAYADPGPGGEAHRPGLSQPGSGRG